MNGSYLQTLAAAVLLLAAFALPGCSPAALSSHDAATFETSVFAPAKPYNRTIFSSMDF